MSLLNHSCSPNVVRHCHGTAMVLRALRPIPAGQQLLDNYGYHHAVMRRDERRRQLQAQYRFLCECDACRDDWPLYQQLPTLSGDAEALEAARVSDCEIEALRRADRQTALRLLGRLLHAATLLERTAPTKNWADNQEIVKQCFAALANTRTLDLRPPS